MIADLDIDLYSPELIADPYPAYKAIRDAGPVCRLPGGVFAMGRHADLKQALSDWSLFSSQSGVALNETMNDALSGTVLASDPPLHTGLRQVVGRPLAPGRLAALRQQITKTAEALVDDLASRGEFCAATDLAQHLPLTIVSELVGMPDDGRRRMLDWAAAVFNSMAMEGSSYAAEALPIVGEMVAYIADAALPERLVPGGWAAELHEAVKAGEITKETFESLLQAYLAPSLDTTIFATSNLMWLLAKHPEQWQRLRDRPALIPRAINEALRLESPVTGFSRLLTRNANIDGVEVPKGSRILMLFAAGNRDERRYPDPDRFDIERDSTDHLSFGHAIHRCVGANLAMLEMTALLTALTRRIRSIEILEEQRTDHAVLRGFSSLKVRVDC
ncbi:cytochrome P450 [Sphingobium sp. DC-2]|uniref:cytochrome P450 n=1 Tax=Sphingobium sp. DC-2 TaxID=1303256 RepID=UPI0004C3EA7B|nr:cytochrome P450 [Sphingobium sp. DC-2]